MKSLGPARGRILVFQHGPEVPPGSLAEVMHEREVEFHVVRLDHGGAVPGLGEGSWAGIVSLGGEMGAYDVEEYPFLVAEKALLAEATESDVPVLGICLGAQLLADATGGKAYLAPHSEAEMVRFEPGVEPDRVIDQLSAPQLSFHRDTFDLPPEAKLLHSSARYPLAFRLRRSIGVQTHPEVDATLVSEWVSVAEGRVMLEASGVDGEELIVEMRSTAAASNRAARAFFSAWLDEVFDSG